MAIYIWFVVIAAALVIEFITNEMVSLWFAGGGIVGLILTFCGLDWYYQALAFIVVSGILLLSFRKLVMKVLMKDEIYMNADKSIGQVFMLLTPIKFNEVGTIKINDITWNVMTEDNTALPVGTLVKIVELRGNRYIVKKHEDEPTTESTAK